MMGGDVLGWVEHLCRPEGETESIFGLLRGRQVWAVADEQKRPWTWSGMVGPGAERMGLEDAVTLWLSDSRFVGLGVLMEDGDGLVCVDLDVREGQSAEVRGRFKRVLAAFAGVGAYVESSVGGCGWHIWVRGVWPEGRKRDGVEVYGGRRFMVCTGNVVRGCKELPGNGRVDELLAGMWQQMGTRNEHGSLSGTHAVNHTGPHATGPVAGPYGAAARLLGIALPTPAAPAAAPAVPQPVPSVAIAQPPAGPAVPQPAAAPHVVNHMPGALPAATPLPGQPVPQALSVAILQPAGPAFTPTLAVSTVPPWLRGREDERVRPAQQVAGVVGTDEEVLRVARAADNAEKFERLWRGQWEGEYRSQSEADLALMSMLGFYVRADDAQVLRLFRASGLGQREKAHRGGYAERTLMGVRRRQVRELAEGEMVAAGAAAMAARALGTAAPAGAGPTQGALQVQLPPTPAAVGQAAAGLYGQRRLQELEAQQRERDRLAAAVAAAQGGIRSTKTAAPAVSWPVAWTSEEAAVRPGTVLAPHVVTPPSVAVMREDLRGPWPAEWTEEAVLGVEMSHPPGRLGEVSRWCMENSYLPFLQSAVTSTFAVAAGLFGHSWQLPQSGLNLYITMVGRSAVGKEAVLGSAGRIMQALQKLNPSAGRFFHFGAFASGPALRRMVADDHSSVAIFVGEWGYVVQGLGDVTNANALGIRREVTDLFQKSAAGSVAGGRVYADKEKTVELAKNVAVTLVGETTPDLFYSSLSYDILADGFLSRFWIIDYDGDRPITNARINNVFPENLARYFAQAAVQAEKLAMTNTWTDVLFTDRAKKIFEDFDRFCVSKFYGREDEALRQVWNRAHLKALKIAALCAVADSYMKPTVRETQAVWATEQVLRDVYGLLRRVESGQVGGSTETQQMKIVQSLIKEYLAGGAKKCEERLRVAGVVPHSWLMERVQDLAPFRKHRLGARMALKQVEDELISQGTLQQVGGVDVRDKFQYHAATKLFYVCYTPE